jgi:hypothetical protein
MTRGPRFARREFLKRAAPVTLSGGLVLALGGTSRLANAQTSPPASGETDASIRYVLDPEQSPLTARGVALREWAIARGGAPEIVTAAVSRFEARFRFQAPDGRWFRRTDGQDTAASFSGSDHQKLQDIADYNSLWFGQASVAPGIYTVSESVFVTHGLAFPWSTGRFVGAGRNFDGSAGYPGTTIVLTATDRPCLIEQGGRKTRIADLTVRGPLYGHIIEADLGNLRSAVDDTIDTAWDLPEIIDKRWAPLAGIAIDPYADTEPPQPYPPAEAPPYLGQPGRHYGREVSSDTLIERVQILGFNTGLVVHPSGGSVQSDYVHANELSIEGCKWGVSIGNTQSRLPTGVHRHIARVFCGFTNRQHGEQRGFLAGTELNCEVGACIKVFDFDLAYIGRFTFDGAYSENCFQLGDIRGGAPVDGTIAFRGCHFDLAYNTSFVPQRGVPKHVVGDPASPRGYSGTGQLSFEDTLLLFRMVCPIMAQKVGLERVTLYCREVNSDAPNLARALAHNGSMGLLMPPGFRPDPAIVTSWRFDLDTLRPGDSATTDANFRQTNRSRGIPWFVQKARPASHDDDRYAVDVPLIAASIPKAAFGVNWAVRGIEVSCDSPPLSAPNANNRHQSPGCLVLDDHDGRWYYIKSRAYGGRGSARVVLDALTDYHDAGSGNVLRSPFHPTEGALWFIETRFYTPRLVLIGDVRAGSPTIENVRLIDGTAAPPADEIAAGDYLWVDPHEPAPLFSTEANEVIAVDPSARSITMGGNATADQEGMRLGLFIRGT